jgi:cold shock CspA family protein
MSSDRREWNVKWFTCVKGVRVHHPQSGDDVFVHFSQFQGMGLSQSDEEGGGSLQFTETPKGLQPLTWC